MILEKKVKEEEIKVRRMQKKEEVLKAKARNISIKEGAAYSLMDGFGLRYITPYAIALGANNIHIGLLTSIPTLAANFIQLLTTKFMRKFSRKKIILTSVSIQAVMWLMLIGIGAMFFVFNVDSNIAPIALIVIYSLLLLIGGIAHPAWMSWMKDLLPESDGNCFLAKRSRIVGGVALVAMLVAGFILDWFKGYNLFIGFAILFAVAFAGRAISAFLFTKKYEPKFMEKDGDTHFRSFITHIRETNFGRYAGFTALMNFAVAIASPFFAVYMLEELNFSYVQYTIVTIASLLVMLLVTPAWGKFADKYGNLTAIKVTSFGIPFVPLLWLASPLIAPEFIVFYLVIAEIFSGFVWAGFNLSSIDFIYDAASRQKVAPYAAIFDSLNSVGIFVGALIGGLIATMSSNIFWMSSILFVFLLSGILRFIVASLMVPQIKEVKKVEHFGMQEIKDQFHHLSIHRIIKILR